jgi:predicted nucleic acid-binding protein
MVIDTSAIVAILFGEPDAERFANALGTAPVRLLSAVTRVELSFVVEGRYGSGRPRTAAARRRLRRLRRDAAAGRNRDRSLAQFRPRPASRRAEHRRLLCLCAGRGGRRCAALQGGRSSLIPTSARLCCPRQWRHDHSGHNKNQGTSIPRCAGKRGSRPYPAVPQIIAPAKARAQCCPWRRTGGKRLKSLGSRFRGNNE